MKKSCKNVIRLFLFTMNTLIKFRLLITLQLHSSITYIAMNRVVPFNFFGIATLQMMQKSTVSESDELGIIATDVGSERRQRFFRGITAVFGSLTVSLASNVWSQLFVVNSDSMGVESTSSGDVKIVYSIDFQPRFDIFTIELHLRRLISFSIPYSSRLSSSFCMQ